MPTTRPSRGFRLHAAAVLWLAAATAAVADDDRQAPLRAQLERIDAARAQRPGDGLLVYYRAMTLAGLDRGDEAVEALRGLTGRRLGLLPTRGLGFDVLWDRPDFQAVREQLAAEEPRTAPAPKRWELPGARRMPEGIAFDATRREAYVGSMAWRRIDVVDRRGRARPFSRPDDGLDAVLGLHVDARRRELLAVSTNALSADGAANPRNAVLRYALAGPRRVQRLDATGARQLNDVAVAADGTVYATDSAGHAVYRVRPGETRLMPLVDPGTAPGANGLAVAADGTLYVAVSTGILRIDPATGERQRLPQPDDVATGSIDGLYWHEGDLVGIHNATNPGRVVRLALADGGRRIAGLDVLQSHDHPLFDEPTTGAVDGDVLLVIANSHVAQLKPDGSLRDPSALKPTRIVAVPLRPVPPLRVSSTAAMPLARPPAANWPLRRGGVL